MLVRGKYILTSANPEEILDGAFRVKDGLISEIGKWKELSSKFPEDTVIGAKNDIIIPVFDQCSWPFFRITYNWYC